MAITREQVEHVAKLARLGISEEEKNKFTTQLDSIVGYIDKLTELDTSGVAEFKQERENVLREDEAVAFEDREAILANAPDREDTFYRVKKVIE